MATWASRRKFLYASSILIVIIVIIAAIFFSIFYKKPTCFDGIMNGNEFGRDCGGSCVKLCQSAFLPARIEWGGGKFEKVAPGFYNVASYIVNPNTNGAAINVPYKFSLFDAQGILITERTGKMTIPARRDTIAFEAALSTGKRIPAKTTFEFLEPPVWFKSHDELDGIAVIDKKYTEDEKNSSLEVTLENKSLFPYKNILISAVLFDSNENAIGFSRTQLDILNPNGDRQIAPFSWPIGRNNKVTTIEVFPVIAPVRD